MGIYNIIDLSLFYFLHLKTDIRFGFNDYYSYGQDKKR